jgi:predicted aspartyl protease
MRGRVVSGGREAVVAFPILGSGGTRVEVEAVIDTGFTGHLTLPADVVRYLALSRRGFV